MALFWQRTGGMGCQGAESSNGVPNNVRIQRLCPRCPDRRGLLIFTGQVAAGLPETPYQHRCTVCGCVDWLESIYPQDPNGVPLGGDIA
jgi:hypothetical protein